MWIRKLSHLLDRRRLPIVEGCFNSLMKVGVKGLVRGDLSGGGPGFNKGGLSILVDKGSIVDP